MPTNAHGQGYSDLNFLIPEIIDHIDYRKGPYFAKNGDFGSAGSADITYRTTVTAPFAIASVGEDHYERAVAAGSTSVSGGLQLLAAAEFQHNDGPWTLPQRLNKSNGLLTLSGGDANQGWSTSLMGYRAHWDSTDQIPQRLIDAGTYLGHPFGRFDAVDPTDGGETNRSSLSGEWHRNGTDSTTRATALGAWRMSVLDVASSSSLLAFTSQMSIRVFVTTKIGLVGFAGAVVDAELPGGWLHPLVRRGVAVDNNSKAAFRGPYRW